MRHFTSTAAAITALALAASSARAAVHDVTIENFAFTPDTITINTGDTVRWTNLDFIGHTATSQTGNGTLVPNGVFASPELKNEGVYQFSFTQPGTFYYYCLPHGSSMQGEISVLTPPSCTADLSADGRVNTIDLTIFLGAFGQSGAGLSGDYNNDGSVNTADLVVLLAQFGCPAPN